MNGVVASCNGTGTHDVMFVSNIFTRVQHRPCIFGSRFKCIKQRAAPVTVDFVIWHCAHSMRNSLAGSIKRSSVRLFVGLSVLPSVCLSHRSIAVAARCGGFAAGRPAGRRYRSIAGAGTWHAGSGMLTAEWTRLDTDLYPTGISGSKVCYPWLPCWLLALMLL